MTAAAPPSVLPVHVEKGRLDPVEAAALVVVVRARAAAAARARDLPAAARPARWRHQERTPGGHGPRMWRNDPK